MTIRPKISETNEGQTASDNLGSPPEEVQVHGTVQPTHQGLTPSRLSSRAAIVQYGELIAKWVDR